MCKYQYRIAHTLNNTYRKFDVLLEKGVLNTAIDNLGYEAHLSCSVCWEDSKIKCTFIIDEKRIRPDQTGSKGSEAD